MIKVFKTTFVLSLSFVLSGLFFVLPPLDIVKATGATLFLSPSAGSFSVGDVFSVKIKVNTGGQAVNAIDGTLSFDPAKLKVVSISKVDSVLSLWVQDPVFSNTNGAVSFAGGRPSPGYNGANGAVITISFKVESAGIGNVGFSSASVLADDGKGTNILSSMIAGSFDLKPKQIDSLPSSQAPTAPAPTIGRAPDAPIIASLSHPNENNWYSNSNPEFLWQLPSDVSGVSVLLHKEPKANPGPISDGLPTSKKYENLEDGIWYFHIKFKNDYGWGEITHRKILIDTAPPEPFEIEVETDEPTNPALRLYFAAVDELSGIAFYEVEVIDQGLKLTRNKSGTKHNPFALDPLPPGSHQIVVKAFDDANNAVSASAAVDILPIEAPVITKAPARISEAQVLGIEGSALPDVGITVFIEPVGDEAMTVETIADSGGFWKLTYDRVLGQGDYNIYVRAKDARGALSNFSQKHSLKVGLPAILEFGRITIDYLTMVITFIVLIAAGIAAAFYAWYRISMWRSRLRRETSEVSEHIKKAFNALRDEVEEQVSMFDKKKGLSSREKTVRDKLKEALDVSETFIAKEVKDIEKELQ